MEKVLRKLWKGKGKLNLGWIIQYKEHFIITKTLGQTKKIECTNDTVISDSEMVCKNHTSQIIQTWLLSVCNSI